MVKSSFVIFAVSPSSVPFQPANEGLRMVYAVDKAGYPSVTAHSNMTCIIISTSNCWYCHRLEERK